MPIIPVLDSIAAARRETALVEHVADVILVMTQDGLLLSANPAARRLLGSAWSDGEALHIQALVHPQDHDRVRRHFA
jgi:PAS domain S-box-containing protein